MLTEVAEKLTKKQQAILPPDIKEPVMLKIAVVEEKKKLWATLLYLRIYKKTLLIFRHPNLCLLLYQCLSECASI